MEPCVGVKCSTSHYLSAKNFFQIVIILMTNLVSLFRVRREIFIKWKMLFKCCFDSASSRCFSSEITFFMLQQERRQQIVTINSPGNVFCEFFTVAQRATRSRNRFFLISMFDGMLHYRNQLCMRLERTGEEKSCSVYESNYQKFTMK